MCCLPGRRATGSRQGSRRYSGELFEGHMGFGPPGPQPGGEAGERLRVRRGEGYCWLNLVKHPAATLHDRRMLSVRCLVW